MSEGGPGRSSSTVAALVVGIITVCGILCLCGGMVSALGLGPTASSESSTTSRPVATTPTSKARPKPTSATKRRSPSPSTTRRAAPSRRPSPKPVATAGAAAATTYAVTGITDGDTIKVRVGSTVERIRVIGIDTPELRPAECYGQQASSKMQSLVQSRRVGLERDPSQADRDRYGRLLRHVVLPDGRYAAQVLIEGGYGRELTYDGAYAHQRAYQAAERRAKAAGRGIWSSGCLAQPVAPVPAAPPPAPAAAPPGGACTIKGNINSEGTKIYHVPGGGSYDQTVITPSKGERMFCSEADAVAAGWRKARN